MQLSLGTLLHGLQRLLQIDRRRDARDQPVELQRNRIFILPTRYGLLFALLGFVMLLGASNYNNSAGFLLTFLLLSVGLVSILHTYRNLAGLSFRAGRCPPVFCGDNAQYSVIVDNARGTTRYALGLLAEGEFQYHDIPPTGEHRLLIRAETKRRGYRRLGTMTVVSRFPLGLFRAWSIISLDTACLVYPRPAVQASLHEDPGSSGTDRQSASHGDDDFLGYRDYQAGDSPRHIDWKAAARGQRLYTKQFAANEGDVLWLDWDACEDGNTEARLSRLCRAVLDCDQRGRCYGLRLPGVTIAPDSGADHRDACLQALALFEGRP